MIPDFIASGELPPGEHPATLNQIEVRYATNPIRRAQYEGLVRCNRKGVIRIDLGDMT